MRILAPLIHTQRILIHLTLTSILRLPRMLIRTILPTSILDTTVHPPRTPITLLRPTSTLDTTVHPPRIPITLLRPTLTLGTILVHLRTWIHTIPLPPATLTTTRLPPHMTLIITLRLLIRVTTPLPTSILPILHTL